MSGIALTPPYILIEVPNDALKFSTDSRVADPRPTNKHRTMAEASPVDRRSSTPNVIPQKRPLGLEDEQHTPAVPSPLNPDVATARARRPPAPREQREKKESLKKREAKGVDGLRSGTPDSQGFGRKSKKPAEGSSILSPLRYSIPAPQPADFDPPQAPILTPAIAKARRQFHESSEQ